MDLELLCHGTDFSTIGEIPIKRLPSDPTPLRGLPGSAVAGKNDDRAARAWRASVEDPHTDERRGFPDLESLFAFLRRATEGGERAQSPEK